MHLWYHTLLYRDTSQWKQNTTKYNRIKKEDSVKGESGMWDWHPLVVLCVILPQKFCPWWAQLQNAANQTLTLIQWGRGSREVELTVIQ